MENASNLLSEVLINIVRAVVNSAQNMEKFSGRLRAAWPLQEMPADV